MHYSVNVVPVADLPGQLTINTAAGGVLVCHAFLT